MPRNVDHSPAGGDVVVDEPRIPARVRKPQDLVRLIVALALTALVIGLADIAVGTADALESDLTIAAGGFPRILLTLFGLAGGLGVIALPVALGADLLFRRHERQLVEALVAALACAILVVGLDRLILAGHLGDVMGALTRPGEFDRTLPIDPIIAVLVAFLTVCRVVGRRWHQWVAVVVVGSQMLTALLAGTLTATALVVSGLLGWAVGLAFRFGLGATPTLPDGRAVAAALIGFGLPVRRLQLTDEPHSADREYTGTLGGEVTFEALVIDRDTFGFDTLRGFLRRLRLRGASTRRPALTVAAEMEHRALMALAYEKLRIPAPRLLAASPVGAYSAVLALTPLTGPTLADVDELTESQLHAIWLTVRRLQSAKVAHRGLERRAIALREPFAGLTDLGNGDIAADDLALRIDLAHVLVATSLVVGTERTVAAAVDALGADAVLRAMPLLQKPAFLAGTRAALKEHGDLLDELHERIEALAPDQPAPPAVELRRVTLRSVVTIIGAGVAGYLLVTMLAKVDVPALVSQANWGWALACLGCAVLTFAGPALSIQGAVETRLHFFRTYQTQLAVAFSGVVAPAAIGNIALNTRYLIRAGIPAAVAGTTVGLVQVAQMMSYVLLIVLSGVAAGTGQTMSFTPPPKLVAAIPVVVLLLLGLAAVPRVRQFVADRVMPQVRTVAPQIARVMRRPQKLARMIAGSLLLDISFVAALVCATRAFGSQAPIAAVAVVYFAGAIIGSAVPTPGGIGGIEAALSAGLVAIGVSGDVAISSVLLYRLATYWLPIPFGWFALNRLQAKGAL